jgi:hypothetical protein
MYVQVEITKENKSRAGGNSVAQKQGNAKQCIGFMDNRYEAVAQRKMQTHANNLIINNPIQKAGWQIVDSRESKEAQDIVTGNVDRSRAAGRVLDGHTVYRDVDPEKGVKDGGKKLRQGEVLHIHAHGLVGGVAGMGHSTFVTALTSKFTVDTIKRSTVIFHSCEVGGGTFLADVLGGLMNKAPGDWNGTTLLAPLHVMIVNKQGVSIVTNAGYNTDADVADRAKRNRPGVLGKKGDNWAGVTVVRGVAQALTPTEAKVKMKAST